MIHVAVSKTVKYFRARAPVATGFNNRQGASDILKAVFDVKKTTCPSNWFPEKNRRNWQKYDIFFFFWPPVDCRYLTQRSVASTITMSL